MMKGLLGLCLSVLPFIFGKKPSKILIIAFLLKAIIASLTDNFVVQSGKIKYPIRFLPKHFNVNILYDYLMYPMISVLLTRLTFNARPFTILKTVLGTSMLLTISQWCLEKRTKLFKYHNWSFRHSFFTLTGTLLLERGFVSFINKISK